jgi:hypothetical protein
MAYLIIPFLPFIRMNVNSCGSVLAMESAYITGEKLKFIKRRKIFPTAFYTIIVQAAKSLSTRFRPGAGVIQSWNTRTGWQAQRGWECPVIIDNMMNLEILFEATSLSGDSTFYNMAVSHADMTLKNHFRMDGSSYHVVDYDMRTGKVRSRCTAQDILIDVYTYNTLYIHKYPMLAILYGYSMIG